MYALANPKATANATRARPASHRPDFRVRCEDRRVTAETYLA
jgi:hypothetical protein